MPEKKLSIQERLALLKEEASDKGFKVSKKGKSSKSIPEQISDAKKKIAVMDERIQRAEDSIAGRDEELNRSKLINEVLIQEILFAEDNLTRFGNEELDWVVQQKKIDKLTETVGLEVIADNPRTLKPFKVRDELEKTIATLMPRIEKGVQSISLREAQLNKAKKALAELREEIQEEEKKVISLTEGMKGTDSKAKDVPKQTGTADLKK